jgi:HSP20 family protein
MKLRYRYVSYGAGRDRVEQMQQLHQLMHQMLARATTRGGSSWQPPTDVYETDGALVVQVELAGTREEDIDVTLFADHLTIAGTRRSRRAEAAAAYYLAGILYGDFNVAVPVLTKVDRDGVEASFENGLLTVTLPKAVGPQPSAISVATKTAAEALPDNDADIMSVRQGAES